MLKVVQYMYISTYPAVRNVIYRKVDAKNQVSGTVPNPRPNQHRLTNHPKYHPCNLIPATPIENTVITSSCAGESNSDNYGNDYALQHGHLQIQPESTYSLLDPVVAIRPPQGPFPPLTPCRLDIPLMTL